MLEVIALLSCVVVGFLLGVNLIVEYARFKLIDFSSISADIAEQTFMKLRGSKGGEAKALKNETSTLAETVGGLMGMLNEIGGADGLKTLLSSVKAKKEPRQLTEEELYSSLK